jgi:hypothetical protein
MIALKSWVCTALLIATTAFTFAQFEPGDGATQTDIYKKNLETLEKENQGKAGSGYLRFWNMLPPGGEPMLLILKTESKSDEPTRAPLIVINYGFKGGDMTGYRRITAGKYSLGFFKPVETKEDGSVPELVWEKLDSITKKKYQIDVKIDECHTALIENKDGIEVALLEDTKEPDYGIQLRIIHRVPGQAVDIGFLRGEEETIVWTGKGPFTETKQIEKLDKLMPFFADITHKNGMKARRSFEVDCSFIRSHTMVVMNDPYGRVVCRTYRDGLKAAIGSD